LGFLISINFKFYFTLGEAAGQRAKSQLGGIRATAVPSGQILASMVQAFFK